MKRILGLIVGALVGWLIWGYFTNDFSVERFFMFLMGLVLGYLLGRHNSLAETKEN